MAHKPKKKRKKANPKLPGKKIGVGILTGSELRRLKAQDRLKKLKNRNKKK